MNDTDTRLDRKTDILQTLLNELNSTISFKVRFHSTPTPQQRQQSILNELNTTVPLKVNQQALFTYCIPLIAGDEEE